MFHLKQTFYHKVRNTVSGSFAFKGRTYNVNDWVIFYSNSANGYISTTEPCQSALRRAVANDSATIKYKCIENPNAIRMLYSCASL